MASKKLGRDEILATFFDDGSYTTLFADGPAAAAFGSANGQPVYVVCQNGAALSAKDLEKTVRVLELAAKTGNPIVTVYDSTGAKLEEGLAVLAANATLSAAVAQLSGVVPQVAVVVGVCGASSALAAANADVCIMAEGAELFFTPPFTSAAKGDKLAKAGSAEFAAKAGVAAMVAKDAAEAALMAAHVVGLLPSNNLSSPSVFAFEAPAAAFPAKRDPAAALAALADKDSLLPLYEGFGKKAVTALGTLNGNAVAMPFAKGFGWGGELNLEYCFEKLFGFGHGQGYPPERREPEMRNKGILDEVRAKTLRPLLEILPELDPALVKGAVAGEHFSELFFAGCKDEAIAAYVKTLL